MLVTPDELLDADGVPAGDDGGLGERRGVEPRRAGRPALTAGATLVAHASRRTRLRPGDVIGSGTVGTGCILELGLRRTAATATLAACPATRSTLEVEGIGALTNRVAPSRRLPPGEGLLS